MKPEFVHKRNVLATECKFAFFFSHANISVIRTDASCTVLLTLKKLKQNGRI